MKSINKLAWVIAIGSLIPFLAEAARAQGGTAKDVNANANKSIPPGKKKTTGTKRTGILPERGSLEDDVDYTPSGPTAEALMFLREFIEEHGRMDNDVAPKTTGPNPEARGGRYHFIPLNRCKARIRETFDGTNDYSAHTFSFAEIDPTKISGDLSTPAASGGTIKSHIQLATRAGRATIELDQIAFHDRVSGLTFEISDNESGENQAKVIGALKTLTELCARR
jgi:hypothetical protein